MAEQYDLFAAGVSEAAPIAVLSAGGRCEDLQGRFAAQGLTGLDEGDTLALVLDLCLAPGADAVAAADALMARFGGVARVLGAPEAEVARFIGGAPARRLGLLHALLLRTLEHPLRARTLLGSSDALRTYLRARLGGLSREVFHVLFLDTKNRLIADERMSEGTVDHAPVYPREVVRRALELSASALVLVHNHPSGDPTPSKADIDLTQQVVAAARALRIAVHDHVVVGGNQVASLRGLGLM
jgi:DNA repair protein RadC